MTPPYQVAVYYFPNYHPDPRNARVHGPGWTEWELIRSARPRFPGHRQPRLPMWGFGDESDPSVMARKIAAAADHGIDAFIFDWYWYDDGPFLERGLERGFLGAPNNQRLKFAIMWANHDWLDIHPARLRECQDGSQTLLYPGTITRATFETAVQHVIENYFKHPSYWTLQGAPYFSIYDLPALVRCLGGFEATREALAWFRATTKAAGFPDLHLNQVFWSQGVLPGEGAQRSPAELLEGLGFNSLTSYVWIHHVPLTDFPAMDYTRVGRAYMRYWQSIEAATRLPYFPNATMGWDSSPRTLQTDAFLNAGYPFTPCLVNNPPAAFKRSLQAIKKRMDQNPASALRVLTINSWNEWTEGSYLEPDDTNGMGYLEAIRDVFGSPH